ncbi:MAG: box helicase [Clostridia bacterium]|jgi:superfamily II DNA or RNA helicase|nr:box helicase [Clostridia bacterium]
MSFLDLKIKKEYRSLIDNIVRDFYIPLLSNAVMYKRAVGFFSSSALIEISKGITGLVRNGGVIQLVASPYLSPDDMDAIKKGYELRNNIIEKALLRELSKPKNHFEEERLNLLANLIADGKLDIKIAFTENENNLGMYHEKMGLVYDELGNIVAFSGSMNETGTALMVNYESIDVFCSWTGDQERVSVKENAFSAIWNNFEPNIQIIDFPNIKKEILDRYKRYPVNLDIDKTEFDEYIKEHSGIYEVSSNRVGAFISPNIKLHDYQIQAIDEWEKRNYRGIFDMATGTGKTFTGLGAIARLCDHTKDNLAVIIVCPYQHLVEQWVDDIKLFNMDPIIGYSGSRHKDYKKRIKNTVFDFNLGIKRFFCFICTNATFASKEIQKELQQLKGNTLLVVDEAHNFGAMNISKTLTDTYKYRLALSATLERHNDDEGTQLLKSYFGEKCIEYTLERAIQEKKLTPYYYYPVFNTLSEAELEQYGILTQEISKCIIQSKNGEKKLSEKGKRLALERARVVAGAIQKVEKLCELMERYKTETHILVYCGATKLLDQDYDNDIEDIRQIDFITKKLGNELGMKVSQFTSRENNEERSLLKREFEKGDNLQVLIAIKCLDEGVNIPMIKTAFILASTTNPKEYIQRRGRVLRLAKGKDYAVIYDFVTMPRPLDTVKHLTIEEVQKDKALVRNELKRIIEFKNLALNPYDSDKLIDDILKAYELYSEVDGEIEDDFIIQG